MTFSYRSRLVMRTVGSLRVVLNTKLFPNMKCEKVSKWGFDSSFTDKIFCVGK